MAKLTDSEHDSPLPQLWGRWKTGWQHTFFLVTLALTTLGVATSDGDIRPIAVLLAPVFALAAWYGYWFVLRHDATAAHLPYLLGAAALWAVMAALNPAMVWVGASSLIPYCMRHTGWAITAVVALAVAWLWRRLAITGELGWTTVLTCTLGALAVTAIISYIAMLDREGRKRQRLINELTAAQTELAAVERQAGILAERQRLARDIHDTLTQGFASISMLLDAALADLPPRGPAFRRVNQAMQAARENLIESRRLIEALRPAQLDTARLPDVVRELTSRLADETGTTATTVVTGNPSTLRLALEAELLRIVQEALTNVRRHANAHEVTVTLSYIDDIVVIDVHDNGIGFDKVAPGVGLSTMEERARALGGTLTIESASGEGTTIAVTVPRTEPGHNVSVSNGSTPAES